MKWGIWIDIFAIMASYLIITLPVASSTTVKIYNDDEVQLGTAYYNPLSFITRDIVIDPESLVVNVALSGSDEEVVLEEIVVFKCRGLDPSSCISEVTPESYQQEMDSGFAWAGIADKTTSYPQRANLLFMIRANDGGKVFWTGLWTEITRTESGFDVSESSDLSQIIIYMTKIGMVTLVKAFIMNNHMIPFNPDWMSRIVFVSSESLYAPGFDEIASAAEGETNGSEIASVSSSYTAILPLLPVNVIKNPVVVYNSPSYVCGDEKCEGDKGETSSNCCLDCPCPDPAKPECGCPSGYCDSTKGCTPEPELRVYGSAQTSVSNCKQEHVIIIPVEIVNTPSVINVDSSWYTLRYKQYPTTCTRLSGSIYECPVTIQPIDDCEEGVFSLGPNSIGMEISFLDKGIETTREIVTGFPHITIGSFTCGNGECETGLGENWEECCYDCGCPSGYCDYYGSASDASCKRDPEEGNIYAREMNPLHFVGVSTSETVNMDVVITDAPESLVVTGTSCTTACTKTTGSCTSSCSVSCSQPESGNLQCRLSFVINDYDRKYDYTLSPGITFDLRYNNGSKLVTKSLTKTFRQISVGSVWCGDRLCSGDENSENCCYDCGCPGENEYCDVSNINAPAQGDECKAVSNTFLVIDDVGSTSLEDSAIGHTIKIKGHIPDSPGGVSLGAGCSIGNDPWIGCEMFCSGSEGTDGRYDVECDLKVPPIDYLSTGLQYYNPNTRMIRISLNGYYILVSYNDGYDKREYAYEYALGALEIEVTSHCGEGGCEFDLGEDEMTCCRDCGCGSFGDDYVCFSGNDLDGECVENSTILLEVNELDPSPPLKCTVGYMYGPCKFTSATDAQVKIINAPVDMGFADGSFTMNGMKEQISCVKGIGYGNFTCPFVPRDLPGMQNNETEVTFTSDFDIAISYMIGGVEVVQDLSAIKEIEVKKEKSQALKSCEREIYDLQESISRMEKRSEENEDLALWAYVFAGVLFLAGITMIICGCFPCSGSSPATGAGTTPGTTPYVPSSEALLPPPEAGAGGATIDPISSGVGTSGVGPSPEPGGTTLSLQAGAPVGCGIAGSMLIGMSMSLLMLGMTLDMSNGQIKLRIEENRMKKAQKQELCSSEYFENMGDVIW